MSTTCIYLLSTFATEYFYFCAFYFIVYFFLEQILFTWCEPFIDATGFVLFWAFQTPRRFPWLFPVFHDLKFSCHFRKLSKSSLFSGIFRHNLPVFHFVLASTYNNLHTKNTIVFHDFPWRTIKFHGFPGLDTEILKFHDFPGFPWPLQTLCKT